MVSGRGTSDIDFLSVTAVSADDNVEVLGGLGSDLHKKYRVYLQYVGIATPPCDYADRLQCMFPGCWWAKLQLFALDPIDLALYKLERNSDRDREDVLRLAQAGAVTNEWLIDGLLFVPFARLRNARTRSGDGTGLGLSIVASIARAHDASISAPTTAVVWS